MQRSDQLVCPRRQHRRGFHRVSRALPVFPQARESERRSVGSAEIERPAAAALTLPFVESICDDQTSAIGESFPESRLRVHRFGPRVDQRGPVRWVVHPVRQKPPPVEPQLPPSSGLIEADRGDLLSGSDVEARCREVGIHVVDREQPGHVRRLRRQREAAAHP